MNERMIDRIAIRALSAAFDEFVAACVDEHGKPRAPSVKALAKARGYLPPGATMSYGYKERREIQERCANARGRATGCIVIAEEPKPIAFTCPACQSQQELKTIDHAGNGTCTNCSLSFNVKLAADWSATK